MKRVFWILPLMLLAGCADSSRNLTVQVYGGGGLTICHSTISPEVLKSGTDERATNTPSISPNFPIVP